MYCLTVKDIGHLIDNDGTFAMISLMTILLIEDEYKLVKALQKGFRLERYAVDVAYDGEEGLRKGMQKDYDVIVLDLMLPKKDGIEVCRALRRKHVHSPILMLTARDGLKDRIEGLDSGADDYLAKPFDFSELLARIRALLRRRKTTEQTKLKIGDLVLDPANHQVKRGGKLIRLSPKEYGLLDYLMRYPDQILSKDQLIEHVWGPDVKHTGNELAVYIRYLRRKVNSRQKERIQTVRGVGYKITS